jgi:hypothetical protein
LPEGIHVCSAGEAVFRFGTGSRQRRRLAGRLRRWIELGRQVEARWLLLDGSFVTAKKNPDDVDAVLFVPPDFAQRVEQGEDAAVELEGMLLTRQPEELFAAEDEADWQGWCEFFGRTREPDGRRKGIVEISL